MLRLQIEIIYFSLTFALKGLHFRGQLNYVNIVGKQKIKFVPAETRKSLIAICSFSCVKYLKYKMDTLIIKFSPLMIIFFHVHQVISEFL